MEATSQAYAREQGTAADVYAPLTTYARVGVKDTSRGLSNPLLGVAGLLCQECLNLGSDLVRGRNWRDCRARQQFAITRKGIVLLLECIDHLGKLR